MKKLLLLISIFSISINLNAQSEESYVVLETTQGVIELKLFPEVAPLAVENFITHVKNGYYDGVIFQRIIKDFMIQGADPTGTGRGGESIWKRSFKDEFKDKLFSRAGVLAMANAGPNTNGSQFFITTVQTYWLNGRHTILDLLLKDLMLLKKLKTLKHYF